MKNKSIHIVGFGSQGSAWAECLRDSGWKVSIYLPGGSSSEARAKEKGFETFSVGELPKKLNRTEGPQLVAVLCPDSAIGPLYDDVLSPFSGELNLILAHGYAVYSGELRPGKPGHFVGMVAPKAIGPQLRKAFVQARESGNEYHALKAAVQEPRSYSKSGIHQPTTEMKANLLQIGLDLGFAQENLITADCETEAVADLISEQGLLCGGFYTLLEWTMSAMRSAGVPPELIREECLTELQLITTLVREKGPSEAFKHFSQAAQCGTVLVKDRLERSRAREELQEQFEEVLSGRFSEALSSEEWKKQVQVLRSQLRTWEERLGFNRDSAESGSTHKPGLTRSSQSSTDSGESEKETLNVSSN